MNMYLLIAIKTFIFLILIILVMKIMGKRELGQTNTFDVVIFFMISELFSFSIVEPDGDVLKSFIPIGIITSMQILISFLVLKNNRFRKILEQNPTLIINDGIINQKAMKKHRFNIDDLMQQIRNNNIDSISQIKYAILESNGSLSVIQKGQESTKTPFALIKDGEIDKRVLQILNKDRNWLMTKLKEKGYNSEKNIYMCILEKNDNLFIVDKHLL